ncbi:MAG: hypothetical protein CUN53_16800 [Phototrophicales bacterium]|nr:MAG: hypothetical protein CUN53_16800 [Phototrophicales bacterium]
MTKLAFAILIIGLLTVAAAQYAGVYAPAAALSGLRGLAVNTRFAEGFCFWQAANRIVTHRLLP